MPLQQMVEYFNDRLEQQHNSGYRPFTINADKVEGIFGPMRVGSELLPIRELNAQSSVIGYAAQIKVSTQQSSPIQNTEVDALLNEQNRAVSATDSIISFDRLTRTVHMLNYLPESHLNGLLFLDVDPRHILGVKTDHGAYFEEIIVRCGLATGNIAISLTINGLYSRFYQSLLKGLHNYQRRGYKMAIKFDMSALDKSALDLIERSGADFIGLSAAGLNQMRHEPMQDKLQALIAASHQIDSLSYLYNGDLDAHPLLAQAGFDLIQSVPRSTTASQHATLSDYAA